MSAPIPLRQDFEASQLRGLAKKSKDGPQARRLLALAATPEYPQDPRAWKCSSQRRPKSIQHAVQGTGLPDRR